MLDEKDRSIAFSKLQPLCVKLARNCCVEDIDALEAVLKELDETSINYFQEYLIFPFRLSLIKKPNEKLLIRCINVIKLVFDRTHVHSWNTFSSLFLQLFGMLSDPNAGQEVIHASEELKCSIFECVLSLIRSSDNEIYEKIYSAPFRLPLAQAFFVLTELLKREKSKTLRITILQVIGDLTYSTDYISIRSETIEKLASEALACYFPGLSITLHCVICGDFKQGHNVTNLALKIFTELIVLVIGDHCPFTQCQPTDNSTSSPHNAVSAVNKNEAWYEEVSRNVGILVKNILPIASHSHWKVRREFLLFAKNLLLKCTHRLKNCMSVLLPAIFALSVDKYKEVSTCSQDLLKELQNKYQALNLASINSVIEDDIYASTSKLIKSKLSANDTQKLYILKSLQGYMQILGSSLNNLLCSMPHVERIILSLISLLEYDTNTVNLVEEVSFPTNFDISAPNLWPRKKFLYFQDEEILDCVCNLCYILGQMENSRLLIDYILDKLQNSNLYTLQCIFLIGCIVKGFAKESNCIELIGDILDELLSPVVWDLALYDTDHINSTQGSDSSQEQCKVINVKTYNSNVYQICLILETIAKCAEQLKCKFRGQLMKILSPVMERAGSSNLVISQSGRVCLHIIAKCCDYPSIAELIKENADYIINSITIQFHHFLHRPEMAVVLQVALEESDAESLAFFSDVVQQALKILDHNQDKAFPLLTILFSVVKCVIKWFPSKKCEENNVPLQSVVRTGLRNALIQYMSAKEEELNLLHNNSEEENFHNAYEENNASLDIKDKESIPLHVSLTSEILKRCIHLQSSRNLYLRMLSLETIEFCILALRDFENQLHPLVHELWNSFVQRFSEDTVVILKAFKVLLVIADECRDFVRVRMLKDVIPKLISFLKKEYNSSLLKNNFRNYQWTNAHKLQLFVLSEIGHLYVKLDTTEKDIAILADVCLPYLSMKQPKILQNAAAKSIKALASIDPDALWLYYNEHYSKDIALIPPHKSLCTLQFPNSTGSDTTVNFDF